MQRPKSSLFKILLVLLCGICIPKISYSQSGASLSKSDIEKIEARLEDLKKDLKQTQEDADRAINRKKELVKLLTNKASQNKLITPNEKSNALKDIPQNIQYSNNTKLSLDIIPNIQVTNLENSSKNSANDQADILKLGKTKSADFSNVQDHSTVTLVDARTSLDVKSESSISLNSPEMDSLNTNFKSASTQSPNEAQASKSSIEKYFLEVESNNKSNKKNSTPFIDKNIDKPFERQILAIKEFDQVNANGPGTPNKIIDGIAFIPINLDEYLVQVVSNSAALGAKELAVQTAKAQKSYMSTPNINPSLTYSRGSYYNAVPYSPYVAPGSNTYSLSGTLEGWGKRSARSNFSDAEIQRNQAELNSLEKNTRFDAVFAFLDTLRVKKLYDSSSNAIRKLKAIKDTAQVDALTATQKNIANDLKYFAYSMGVFAGNTSNRLFEPEDELNKFRPRDFNVQQLVDQALNQRVDILYFIDAIKAADASLELAKKNRNINLTPSVWLSQTPPYNSGESQYKRTEAFGFSVTAPIPTNLLFDGDLVQEANNKSSLELYLKDLRMRVTAEVNQALLQYNFAKTKLLDEQKDYATTAKLNSGNLSKSIIVMRDKEAELVDAKINHAKALIYLLRMSGDYEIPKI